MYFCENYKNLCENNRILAAIITRNLKSRETSNLTSSPLPRYRNVLATLDSAEKKTTMTKDVGEGKEQATPGGFLSSENN